MWWCSWRWCLDASGYRERADISSESENYVGSSSETGTSNSSHEDAFDVNFEFEIDLNNERHDFAMANIDWCCTVRDILILKVCFVHDRIDNNGIKCTVCSNTYHYKCPDPPI